MNQNLDLMEEIFAKMNEDISLGFDADVLKILDNPDSSEEERERITQKISPEITGRILGLANSACIGTFGRDKITTMSGAIMRLGTIYIKVFILGFSQLALAKDDKSKRILAESFATAFVGKSLAKQSGWRKEIIQEVEIACLLLGIGKVLLHLYEKSSGNNLSEEFIEECHWRIALKFIEKYELPPFIENSIIRIFDQNRLDFKEGGIISKTGVTMLAHTTVKHIFALKERMVVASPVKNSNDCSIETPGEEILKYFKSIGLSDRYLEIIMK